MSAVTHQHQQMNRFVRELHLALTVQEVREVFFDRITRVLPADGVGFYRFRGATSPLQPVRGAQQRRNVDLAANLSSDFLNRYEEHGRRDDPVLLHALKHRRPVDSSRLPSAEWRNSAARRILTSEGLEHSLETPLVASGTVVGTLNLARERGSRTFSEEDLGLVRSVGSTMNLAMERATRLEETQFSSDSTAAEDSRCGCAGEGPARSGVWQILSAREQEIVDLVGRGMTTKQIAAEAFISENTVKQHLKRIFAKTGAHSRAELVQLIWSPTSSRRG